MRVTLLILLTLALAACNTMQGVGRDLSAAGNGIANAAK